MRIEKSNILLIGPSGSGKTHLVKSLASYLNVPLVIGDATSLTEAGYVGENVASLLFRLLLAAGGDLDAATELELYSCFITHELKVYCIFGSPATA